MDFDLPPYDFDVWNRSHKIRVNKLFKIKTEYSCQTHLDRNKVRFFEKVTYLFFSPTINEQQQRRGVAMHSRFKVL